MAKKEFEYEYDPVKYDKGGKEAEKVIWTTKSLDAAVKALNEGLPLKANPFIGKNTKLLKPDLLYKRTQEEIDDYIHCMEDPIYFGSKCFLMTPEGLQPCVLRDYQEDYLNHVKNNRFSIFLSCRQSGKCFCPVDKVTIKLKNNFQIDDKLKKLNYFYIKDNIYQLPIFELINLFENSFIWKIKYHIYKLIYKLQLWQEKLDKNM